MREKIIAFEYVLFKLIDWQREANPDNQNNDISTLKALKLLFFVSAVGTKKDSAETLLDIVFDDFVAMPYGHVESDVYAAIKSGSLSYSIINNSQTSKIGEPDFRALLDANVISKIDTAFEELKNKNPKLINMNAFDLVELSHSWYSWKYYFARAKRNHTFSESIPTEIIKAEEKIFSLN
jgi:uncharacterized phage-associated protein